MTHQFTEIAVTGYGTRLRNAIFGVLVGLIMVGSAFVLIFWNEERGLAAEGALDDALNAAVTISAYRIDPEHDGRLVHLSGTSRTASPVADPLFRLDVPDVLRLRRRVEMVQWHERTTTTKTDNLGGGQTTRTTYDYVLDWSEEPVGSANFRYFEGHQNPRMPVQTRIFNVEDGRIGAVRLLDPALDRMDGFEPRFIAADELNRAEGFVNDGEYLYRGRNPAQLTLGDLRMRYEVVPNGTYTVMGQQWNDGIAAWRNRDGYEMLLVEPGDWSAAEMIDKARFREEWTTWLMRLVGVLLMTFGFLFLLAPLPAVAAVIPLVADVIGAGVFFVALMLGLPLSLLAIGASWLWLRPLWALGTIAIGLAFGFAIYRWASR